MKPRRLLASRLSLPLASAIAALLAAPLAQAQTYTWDSSNVTGTPTPTLDWFTGGSNSLGLWTGPVVPVSSNLNTIRFFADTTTSLPNTAVPSTQTANLNNGGSAFELGTLTLNGFGSATSGASITMTLQGDALNFSAATGTISFNSVKNVAPAVDPVVNYTINNNIQLGTVSSASALTLTGNGDNAGSTTYNIGGTISELQTGGGSLAKSGSSLVTISGAVNITGGVTVSAGQLTLTNSTINASTLTVNGGTLIMTGSRTPASGSMTVNTGGILQIGNNTATQYGPAGVYSGNISTGTGGTLRLWSSSSQEISGVISGSGGINKAYGGALTLSGANTYTGRTSFQPANTTGFTANVSSFNSVNGGSPLLANSSLGAPTTISNGTVDIGSGTAQASVNLTYTGASGETTDRVMNIVFNSNSSQTITANNASGVLRFTSAFTSSPTTGSGSLTLRGTGQGQIDQGLPQLSLGGLIKNDAGTWTLGGSGTFTGATLISGGTLRLSSATALQNSPFNTASVAGGAGAGLRIDTTALTLGGLTGGNPLRGRFTTALGGPSSATAQGGYDGLTNLTLNTVAGSTSTYTGAIVDGAAGMSLTKTGAGIQTITSANTYTGTTFVNGGFLQLNGSTLTGGLSVSNATFASNSTFAGASTVTSGGIISPGASSGAIGAITFSNASASALTLGGSTGIFDLPSTVTTPDRIAVTGGLVVTGTNTVLLRTPTAGTPAGTYTLITSGASPTGAGSFVLANGSATRGNATISTSGNDVILTVAEGGLAGTTTFNGPYGSGGTDRWNVAGSWSGGVPTGTINAVIPDQTSAQVVAITSTTTPTYTGDLWIGSNVTLQVNFTSANAAYTNALGTSGSTIIYMGANSAINYRNNGFIPTMPAITLLGDASMRFQESTQAAVSPNFANSISGPFTLTFNSGNGPTYTLNAANSFAGLNLAGTTGIVNAAVSGSIGTANLIISGGGTVNLNHATALADGTNPIQINNGTVTYGITPAATLTLTDRPIELNGTGQATINNNNTLSSSANILTLAGGISSTAAGAKTLTLGGTNVGLNTISGNITNGSGGGTVALTKSGAGTWVLSGANTYTGTTTISASGGVLAGIGANAFGSSAISISSGTLSLRGDTSTSFVRASDSAPYVITTTATGATINVDQATIAGTTAKTMSIGAIGTSSTATAYQVNFTGANSTSLSAGAVTGPVSTAAGTVTLNNSIAGGGNLTLSSYTGANTTGGETLTFSGDGSTTVTGNVLKSATNLGVTKSGTGTLRLEGSGNTFNSTITLSGTTTSAGTIAYASAGGANPITFSATTGFGSTLNYIGSSPLTMTGAITTTALTTGGVEFQANGTSPTATINYSNTGSIGTSNSTGQGFITFGGANTGDNTFAGIIANNTGSGGTRQVAKTGAGTWVFTGNSTYTGGFFLSQGTVKVSSVGNSGVSGPLGSNSRINLGRDNNDGTLIFTGSGSTTNRDVRIGGPSTASGTGGSTILSEGSGAVIFTASTFNPTQTGINFNRTLTLGGSFTGAANEIQGVIQNNTAVTGLVGVTKTGNSTWLLGGANTYTGTTAVNGGTLALGASNVLPDASNISIGNATLDGSTFTDTAGTLTITGSAVINLGSGGAIAFADSSAAAWSGSLNITGIFVSGASIRFGTSAAGLTTDQKNAITVNGAGAGTYTLDADGYVVGGGVDTTPPTLTSINDNVSGGPVDINTPITYTVTFSEDINASTVSDLDFGNAGTAPITIGTITETSPGVFTVVVTPTNSGSVQLRINQGAVIEDTATIPNALVTTSALLDNTTITVRTIYESWANTNSATGGKAGDPDGDGYNNLMEFAFDTNPTTNSAASIAYSGGVVTAHGQPILLQESGTYYAVFGRRVNYVAAGLVYTVEFSAGLDQWTSSATGLTTVATDGVIDAIRVPFPNLVSTPSGPKKPTFFRVLISE